MRALRMEPLEDPIYKVLPLEAPFIESRTEKGRLQIGKGFSAGLALVLAARNVWHEQVGYLVEKGFQGASDLAIGRGPVAPPVGGDGLVKMAERRGEIVSIEQSVNFIICGRKVERFRERPPHLSVLDHVACALQGADEHFSGAVLRYVSGGFLYDEVG